MNCAAALAWYTELARKPQWKAYVWHQVQWLASEHPTEFRDLPAMLTAAMKELTHA